MDYERTASALSYIECSSLDNEDWLKVVACVKTFLGTEGYDLAQDWSSTDPRYKAKEFRATWRSLKPRKNGEAALFGMAKDNGWRADEYRATTQADLEARERRKAAIAQHEKEETEQRRKWFLNMDAEYKAASPASSYHPYLCDKKQGLELHKASSDVKQISDGRLCIPISNISGDTIGYECIDDDGGKKIYGTHSQGFYIIGNISNGRAWLCEGFATGLTVHAATKEAVVVCYNDHNLVVVSRILKENCKHLVVAADNDIAKTDAGRKAAEKTGLPYSIPDFTGYYCEDVPNPTDWDDLRLIAGIGTVATLIVQGLADTASNKLEPPIDISQVDISKPPEFVGDVCDWINGQCVFPRESLAVLASLYAVGCIGGLSHEDADMFIPAKANILGFGIAGSGSGKEAIYEAVNTLLITAGMGRVKYGGIKSEQEIARNLVNDQVSAYVMDEMGLVLAQLKNSNGTSYLAGIPKSIMEGYTKSSGTWNIRGDDIREITKDLRNGLKSLEKELESGDSDIEDDVLQRMIDSRKERIKEMQEKGGIVRPFLGLFGLSTSTTFNDHVDYEQVTNGFFSRALIANEYETNPRVKKGFKGKTPMSDGLKIGIKCLTIGTSYDSDTAERICEPKDKKMVRSSEDAVKAMMDIIEYFHAVGETLKEDGMEAIARRGAELVNKVSFILAMHGQIRDIEHVRWALAYVIVDMRKKLSLAKLNVSQTYDDQSEACRNSVLAAIPADEGKARSASQIANYGKNRRLYKRAQVEEVLKFLVDEAIIKTIETPRAIKYFKG